MKMDNNKKLSIVTINYNNSAGLKKTVESVVGQTFRDYEYIVIDGGSTDGSVNVIHDYSNRIDYWVSQKDHGIYHAMNKGAFAAHGEYLLFLNSGDALLEESVLEKVFNFSLDADVVCGNIINDRGGRMDAPECVTMEYFLLGCLPHPATFVKRSLFLFHPYDERYKIAGDWEFLMHHLIARNVSYQHVDITVTLFDTTGISCTTNKDAQDLQLRKNAISQILPPRVIDDYDIFMGKKDNYHKLFYILGHTEKKRYFYKLILFILKIATLNQGWVRGFSYK